MAKTRKKKTAIIEETGSALERTATDIGAGLGHLLNQVEGQWKTARSGRDGLIANLRNIRDKANALLGEAGEIEIPLLRRTRGAKRKVKKAGGAKKAKSAVKPRAKKATKSAKKSAKR